jgi:PadR family transcriptional regulator PadR
MGSDTPELLSGTLDLLIVRALRGGSKHGYCIAEHLRAQSDDVLQVGESSLYPALQRKARYYTLAAAGTKPLTVEVEEFDRMTLAIHKVLKAAT